MEPGKSNSDPPANFTRSLTSSGPEPGQVNDCGAPVPPVECSVCHPIESVTACTSSLGFTLTEKESCGCCALAGKKAADTPAARLKNATNAGVAEGLPGLATYSLP